MSALGQKQTCAAHKGMSALPPKADNLQGTSPCPLSANRGHPSSHIYRRRLSMILGLRVFKRWLCDVGILPTRSHHVEPGALGDAARLHAGVARAGSNGLPRKAGRAGAAVFVGKCASRCVTVLLPRGDAVTHVTHFSIKVLTWFSPLLEKCEDWKQLTSGGPQALMQPVGFGVHDGGELEDVVGVTHGRHASSARGR